MDIKQRIAGRAFIVHDSKILLIREAKTYEGGTNIGKYDTPGGKIHPGESYQVGLKREVFEECGLEIHIGQPFYIGEWRPVVHGKSLQIIAIFSECEAITRDVKLGTDHDDYQWIAPQDYKNFDVIDSAVGAFDAYMHFIKNRII